MDGEFRVGHGHHRLNLTLRCWCLMAFRAQVCSLIWEVLLRGWGGTRKLGTEQIDEHHGHVPQDKGTVLKGYCACQQVIQDMVQETWSESDMCLTESRFQCVSNCG